MPPLAQLPPLTGKVIVKGELTVIVRVEARARAPGSFGRRVEVQIVPDLSGTYCAG